VQEFLLIDMYLNSVSISDIAELLEKTERSILNKLGKLKKSELYKLDMLRQKRLGNFIKKEEEGRLRNLDMIIETYSADDDDDNNEYFKKMKLILTGVSAGSILIIAFCLTKYLIK
jgi:CRISPR/Cas system CSM-associated protein Csm2 small subunit